MGKLIKEKYFFNVLFLIFIAFLITVNLLSYSLYKVYEYFSIEKIKGIREENLKEVANIDDNIRTTALIISNNLKKDPSIRKVFNKTTSNFEEIEAIRNIVSIKSMSPDIDSIALYRIKDGRFFSSTERSHYYLEEYPDKQLIKHMGQTPVIRRENFSGRDRTVLTYKTPIFDSNLEVGYLIININMDWLEKINKRQGSNIHILDENSKLVYPMDQDSRLISENNIKNLTKNTGVNPIKTGDKNNIVLLYKPERTSFSYITVGERNTITGYNQFIIKYTAGIVGIFLVLTMIISLFLTVKITNPIRALEKLIWSFNNKDDRTSGDIVYLTSSIENIIEDILDLEEKTQVYLQRLHKEILTEIILGNIRGREIQNTVDKYNLDLSMNDNFTLIYSLDGGKYIKDEGRDLSEGIHSLKFEEDRIHVLVNSSPQKQMQVINSFKFSGVKFIIIVSGIYGLRDLNIGYRKLKDKIRYKIFYQGDNVLHIEDMDREPISYPYDIEEDLINSLRRADKDKAIDLYRIFIEEVGKADYLDFRNHIFRLYFSIRDLAKSLDENDSFFDSNIFKTETFQNKLNKLIYYRDLDTYFLSLFEEVASIIMVSKSRRNISIIEEAIDLVEKEYGDNNFSIQDISEKMDLSSSYLNQIAKEEKGFSISEYITNFRIEKSKELLEKNDKTVKEIALEVGFNNDNYFYTVFKRVMDMTPGEYRKHQLRTGYKNTEQSEN